MSESDTVSYSDACPKFFLDRELLRRAVKALSGTFMVLLAFGILMVASASSARAIGLNCPPFYFLYRQVMWLFIGAVALILAAVIDYHVWTKYVWWLLGITVTMLIAVLLFGRTVGGCTRWLDLGFLRFQPSELGKFTSIVFLSYWLSKYATRMHERCMGLLIPGGIAGFMMLLVLKEPDVGTAMLIGALVWAMLFIGGAPRNWLVIGALLLALGFLVYLRLDDHRWSRVIATYFPDLYPDISRQVTESQNAFKIGGFRINPGGSLEKHYFLPEVHTDFIFAIVGEELGFVGSITVVAIFAILFAAGLIISFNAPDAIGRYMAFGITFAIVTQALFNMCVVTGMIPTKGIALPGFSYGGSSLVIFMLQAGVLLNIGHRSIHKPGGIHVTVR